jgi:hypothetical protein
MVNSSSCTPVEMPDTMPDCGAPAAGEFAEAVRSQFMEERMDYFRAVESAVYEESGFQVGRHDTLRSVMPPQMM